MAIISNEYDLTPFAKMVNSRSVEVFLEASTILVDKISYFYKWSQQWKL